MWCDFSLYDGISEAKAMSLRKGDQLKLTPMNDGMLYEIVEKLETKPDPDGEYSLVTVVLREKPARVEGWR